MTVINESLTAKGFTPQAQVPLVYGRPRTIESLTIHWWGSYGQTHDGVNNFFVNGPGETSAHFTASANRLNCLVYPWDAAWHAGNAIGNASSVGIECRPEGTDQDYATIAELIRFLRDTYGPKLPLIPHRHWQNTACPGTYDLVRLHRMAEAISNPMPGIKPPAPKPPVAPKPTAGDIVNLDFYREQPVKKAQNRHLAPGQAWFLKEADGKNNWDVAGKNLGYYDADLFIAGTGLKDGETVTVQVYVVTGAERNLSGYYTQDIEGSNSGKWQGNIRFKTPLLSTARLEVSVTASSDCFIDTWGSDTYVFRK